MLKRSEVFKSYAKSYKVEVVDSRDRLAQLEAGNYLSQN